ncbi:MAG: hypothetical protein AABX89_01490 [Candidatus Thermoplasmatota archaeon]
MRPPILVGVAVVVAALSVAWMMSLRAGSRMAGEFESEEAGPVASSVAADWSDVTLEPSALVHVSLDGPARLVSEPFAPGIARPASAVARPIADGDALALCTPLAPAYDVVVILRGPAGVEALRFAAVPVCR